jgi:hypothetical protein
MTHHDRRLARQLGFAVLLKLALLAILWWAFVRPFHVEASPQALADRLGAGPRLQEANQGSTR